MLPILYSFRRCPYAMRARYAICLAGRDVELREVVLKNKPQSLINLSAKATVPVLLLPNGRVVDESLDIMIWALSETQYIEKTVAFDEQLALIQQNDKEFKYWLDRYKYFDRFPEYSQQYYQQQAEKYVCVLEERLSKNNFLFGEGISFADIAIMPFIRQFSLVDDDNFNHMSYPYVKAWLVLLLNSEIFSRIMKKYTPWKEGDNICILEGNTLRD